MMNRGNYIDRFAWVVCLLATMFFAPQAYSRQNSEVVTPEKEFMDAIRKGDAVKVREMLKQSPTLARTAAAKSGATPVLFAIYTNHKEIAELILASGIEPNIFEAAATGRVERVRELLKKSPDLVKAYSADGWTALHLNFGHAEIVTLLLENGADVNAVSKNRFIATPLQGAAVSKWIDVARILLAHGAKVNTRGEGGSSPLHEAAGNGQIEFAQLLLDHQADVNAKSDDGKTPLTIALESKQIEMAKFLREHGAAQ
jgi:ankyrin repeat protein